MRPPLLPAYNPSPSTHAATSLAAVPPAKRRPSSHSPVPAIAARSCALEPMGDEPDVQNGMTVLPVKSLPATKLSIAHEALPHQMG